MQRLLAFRYYLTCCEVLRATQVVQSVGLSQAVEHRDLSRTITCNIQSHEPSQFVFHVKDHIAYSSLNGAVKGNVTVISALICISFVTGHTTRRNVAAHVIRIRQTTLVWLRRVCE